MTSLVLTVRIAEAALRETGDGRGRVGENVVNVALLCPRPGKAEVVGSTGLVLLTDHVRPEDPPDRPPLFAVPVLKEAVEGDCALLVHVLDRDEPRKLLRFLTRLAGAAIESAPLGVPGLVRHVFTEAAETGAVLVSGDWRDTDRLEVIAACDAPVVLTGPELAALASKPEPRRVTVRMSAPPDLERPGEKGPLAPRRPNGHLVLELGVARS